MANLIPKNLYIGNDTASNVYTVSATTGSYAILRNVNICNVTDTVSDCSLFIIGPSGTPGNNNAVLKTFAIQGRETVSYDASIVLDSGNKIHVLNTNNNCTFTISGVEYTA